jgi:hypothetical protein
LYDVSFLDGPFDVFVKLSGVADLQDLAECRQRLLEDSRFRPGMSALYDLAGLDMSGLSGEAIRALGNESSRTIPVGRLAFAVPDTAAFGLLRMYGATSWSERLGDDFVVVRSIDEAYDWIAGRAPDVS